MISNEHHDDSEAQPIYNGERDNSGERKVLFTQMASDELVNVLRESFYFFTFTFPKFSVLLN